MGRRGSLWVLFAVVLLGWAGILFHFLRVLFAWVLFAVVLLGWAGVQGAPQGSGSEAWKAVRVMGWVRFAEGKDVVGYFELRDVKSGTWVLALNAKGDPEGVLRVGRVAFGHFVGMRLVEGVAYKGQFVVVVENQKDRPLLEDFKRWNKAEREREAERAKGKGAKAKGE